MPRLTLVYPSMGRRPGGGFVRTWEWEPLAMGVLAALTPKEWGVRFFDDRVEAVDYDAPADLVAISIESYSARRGYQIAAGFRSRGIPVVMGGYHATACPEEVMAHADAVCVGEVEGLWEMILEDALSGRLAGRYERREKPDLSNLNMDRSIFRGKGYLPIALVEVGRGCPLRCDFCSISAFYSATYRCRPPEDVAEELRSIGSRKVFLVDDNLTGNLESARRLFAAIRPVGARWITQTGLAGLEDESFVKDMAGSGCIGILIGLESLIAENLAAMNKGANRVERYSKVLSNLRKAGIFVYGTFLFGYSHDTPQVFDESVRFAVKEKMFMAAFNHLVPFPGTPLYRELERAGRLKYMKWWLSEEFRFGQVPYIPAIMAPSEIEERCLKARRDFYSIPSILRRATDFRCNCSNPLKAFRYFGVNRIMRREVEQKRGIPLGFSES